MKRIGCLVCLGLMGLLAGFGCSRSPDVATIEIDGSSTVWPLTSAVAEDFKGKNPAVRVTVNQSGTGGGFKKFLRGETDISDASRPISKSEIEEARKEGIEYIELPVAYDAITVVVNPQNDWVKSMTIEDLKKIWAPEAKGTITKWNQVRPEWPEEDLVLYGPGTDSGTWEYFNEAVLGKEKSSRSDYNANEDDNVLVQGVKGNKGALGYFGYGYYAANEASLKAVPIISNKTPDKGPVTPSTESVLKGDYNPFSRPVFIYVNKKSLQDKPAVKEFVEYYLANADKLAPTKEVGLVPLPDNAYQMARDRFENRSTGTGFTGSPEVGLPIEEILKRQPKS